MIETNDDKRAHIDKKNVPHLYFVDRPAGIQRLADTTKGSTNHKNNQRKTHDEGNDESDRDGYEKCHQKLTIAKYAAREQKYTSEKVCLPGFFF